MKNLTTLLIALVSFTAFSQTNLFLDGSLETWTLSGTPNETPDLWTNCSTGGIGVDCVPGSCTGVPAAGTDGPNYARAIGGEGLSQDISTVIGQTYVIEFDYCGVSSCFGGGTDSAWDVEVDGSSIYVTPGGVGTVWTLGTTSFVATNTTTNICFKKLTGTGQGGVDRLTVYTSCQSTAANLTELSCDSYTSPCGNYTWTTTGNYLDTIANMAGCDSVLTIDLTINSVDNSVTQLDDITLESNTSNATYQWVDCEDGYAAIVGETNQDFVAGSNGNYAVIVTENGCSDTSACYVINQVGIIIDFIGRETEFKPNTPLIYIYNDGTRKRVMKLEE